MPKLIRKIASLIIPEQIKKKAVVMMYDLFDGYALKSYSQEGEDMILRRLFENQERGLYVDIGAYHPKKFSNTYFFYRAGWIGINVDAMPGSMKKFRSRRPRDINIEAAISDKREELIPKGIFYLARK